MSNVKFKLDGIDLSEIAVSKETFLDIYPNINPGNSAIQTMIVSTGYSIYGERGDNGSTNRNTIINNPPLTEVPGGGKNWKALSLAGGYVNAIKSDGTLWQWGRNLFDAVSRSSPAQVGSSTNWKLVNSKGVVNAGAIKTDGTLWIWGTNVHGSIGDNTTISRSSPTQVGSSTNWKSISFGYDSPLQTATAAAIKMDGTLWTWGYNNAGTMGINDRVHRSSPTQVGSSTDWKTVDAGDEYMVAIKTDGTMWSWGTNVNGVLGINLSGFGGFDNRSSPVQIGINTNWNKIICAIDYVFALKTDNSLWSWGYNTEGVLGFSDTISRSSPTQLGTKDTWYKISAFWEQSVYAIKTDGTLWTWGRLDQKVEDDIGIDFRSSPIQIYSGNSWVDVSSGAVGPGYGGSALMLKDVTTSIYGDNLL